MIAIVHIAEVEALDGFQLAVKFTDGSEGIEDLATFVAEGGPMVVPLREPSFFKRVFLSFGAPSTWPNGFDLDPTALQMRLEEAGQLVRPLAAE